MKRFGPINTISADKRDLEFNTDTNPFLNHQTDLRSWRSHRVYLPGYLVRYAPESTLRDIDIVDFDTTKTNCTYSLQKNKNAYSIFRIKQSINSAIF